MTRPYNRLPNYVEDARLDAIAISLDICDLAFRQMRAMQDGDWPRVVLINHTIDARARAIQSHLKEMKSKGASTAQQRDQP